MSGAKLILRIVGVSVLMLIIGVFGAFGFQLLEPIHSAFGEPASSLGWGSPGLLALEMAAAGFLGVALSLCSGSVFSPISDDVRQEVR